MRSINFRHWLLGLGVVFLAVASSGAQGLAPLPEGDAGVAAKHPGDAGIEKDPAVLFHDGFEDVSVANDLRRKWDAGVHHDATIRITDESANVHSGRKALELNHPKRNSAVGNGLMRKVQPEQNLVFLRYYHKFDKDLDIKGAGSFHNGGAIAAHYHSGGVSTPGRRADGRNKFLVEVGAAWFAGPKPGYLHVYAYHPEQRGNFGDAFMPNGEIGRGRKGDFGPDFVPRPHFVPELDRWYCYELMVKANTPGKRDGRIAYWLDGKLMADFPNIRLRDVATLTIDNFSIGGYINPNRVRENKLWFDDVVAARSYIGPQRAK